MKALQCIPLVIAAMTVLPGAASATTRVWLANNGNGTSLPPIVDTPGPHELIDAGALSRGQADYGTLKALAQANETCSCAATYSFASIETRDDVTVDAGARNGQVGYARIRFDYSWAMNATLGPADAGVLNTGDAGFLFAGHGGYARRYDYSGTSFRDNVNIESAFSAGSPDTQLVSAVLGSHIEVIAPIQLGGAVHLQSWLSVSSTAINASASVNAFNSAYWGGMKVYDANMQEIAFTAIGASGADYSQSFTPAVPEPSTYLLAVTGLLVVARAARRTGSASS